MVIVLYDHLDFSQGARHNLNCGFAIISRWCNLGSCGDQLAANRRLNHRKQTEREHLGVGGNPVDYGDFLDTGRARWCASERRRQAERHDSDPGHCVLGR